MLTLTTATTTSSSFNPVVSLVVAILFAVACYVLAGRKGRRPVLWAVLGFFFTLISLIVVAVLPSKSGSTTSANPY